MNDNKEKKGILKDSSFNKNKDQQPPRKGCIYGLPMYTTTFGSKSQSDAFVKTTEAMGNYVGREYYGKKMKSNLGGLEQSSKAMPHESLAQFYKRWAT